jgi:hypothetical protein
VLGADPARTVDDFRYVSNNFTDVGLRTSYESALTRVVQKDRIKAADIAPKVAAHIQEQIVCKPLQADSKGGTADVKKENVVDQWAPVGFVYFLWMAILGVASMLLTNTVEEKSNRIIEVLLSSVSPTQLMQGKIWGIAATGMTMVLVWVVFALAALAGRKVTRRYVALCWGHFATDNITVEKPIGRDPRDRTKMTIVPDGRMSRTDFVRLGRFDSADLLRAHLHSGRTHQIRVHLSSIGHPILGDFFYSPPSIYTASSRLMLHSEELRIKHPITNQDMRFNAPSRFKLEDYDYL